MAKVGILIPFPEMHDRVSSLLKEYPYIEPVCVECCRNEDVVEHTQELIRHGCELIIARGLQASMIRSKTEIPMVEMQVTTQEIGLLLKEARAEIGGEKPILALIGFGDMVGDISHFDELFNVELRYYIVTETDDLAAIVRQAVKDGVQGLIGGNVACRTADELGVYNRFLPTGDESIRNALSSANQICYAMEIEKRNAAEMGALFDNIGSGIIQIDGTGRILRFNSMAKTLLDISASDISGRDIRECVPGLSVQSLEAAIREGRESYTSFLDKKRRTVIVNAVPIKIDDKAYGAILTFQEDARIIEMGSELRRELYQRGFVARYTFSNIVAQSQSTLRCVELAKRMSKVIAPVLISGEPGTGKEMMAQCIHNESVLRENAFVTVDCSAWSSDTLDTMLFGDYTTRIDAPPCIAELAEGGTLYIAHIEKMAYEAQYKLLNLMRGKLFHNGRLRPSAANVRVIVSTSTGLVELMEKGDFRNDLYYALSVLQLELPPIRKRRDDIAEWVDVYIDFWQKKYKRYIHLTQEAKRFMKEYAWPGNLEQMNSVCERIVLLAERKNVDEIFVRAQLEHMLPQKFPQGDEKRILEPRAQELVDALKKWGGNREKAAQELGISKTTLWRKMQKYEISSNDF